MTADPDITVLVIDDEPQIRRLIRNMLESVAAHVLEAATARDGLDLAASRQPALIILDLGLPDQDGFEVCRDLRSFTQAPVIVLSARHSDREKERLLDIGADDYVTKPFSAVELKARIRAQLRRAHPATPAQGTPSSIISAYGVTVDLTARKVSRDGREVHLTPTEWTLLRTFIRHAGRTMTHAQLFAEVWGAGAGDAQQYLRVYVAQLRRKLEVDPLRPRLIRTEPAVGYRFELEE